MIYILEGPDGVGKTTLASAINHQTKGHIFHCTWKKDWDMRQYFLDVLNAAKSINKYQSVVIDRWAPSEHVYSQAFRGGPAFDVFEFLWTHGIDEDITFIICRNDNAIENHLKHRERRIEMFDDISKVVKGFDDFVKDTEFLNWTTYDFDKVNKYAFVKRLLSDHER